MSKIIFKILTFLICVFCLLALFSCKSAPTESEINEPTESIPTEIFASFKSVEEFKIAIKKNPSLYNGKRISVKGYANKSSSTRFGSDWLYDKFLPDNLTYDDRPRVKIIISDNLKLSVLEDGDYVDLNGVVQITSEEVYLSHCTYTMVKTNEEQKSN